jgi:cap1 methyltransferase
MANLDALFHLTTTTDDQILDFADVCAGPGGFSEYILWRKKHLARGFGFTLRGKDDWKLEKFHPEAPTTAFQTCYGEDDTGRFTIGESNHLQEISFVAKIFAISRKSLTCKLNR